MKQLIGQKLSSVRTTYGEELVLGFGGCHPATHPKVKQPRYDIELWADLSDWEIGDLTSDEVFDAGKLDREKFPVDDGDTVIDVEDQEHRWKIVFNCGYVLYITKEARLRVLPP